MVSKKTDVIRDRYFAPLEKAELAADILFYVSATLSLLSPLVERKAHPFAYDGVQTLFILSVLAMFTTGLLIRLHFSPRAQYKRYQDFLSHAYGVRLSHEQTTGYYDSSTLSVPHRIAAQVLENSFYSKDTALQMVRFDRARMATYFIAWLVVILNRASDLATVAIIAQIVFSEQLISRWLRLEWLLREFERTYEDLFRLFQSHARFDVVALELLGRYEIAKATAAITLSARVFERRSPSMDSEWKAVKEILGL